MNESLLQNMIARPSEAKGITLFLIVVLLFSPLISTVNYLWADQCTYVMLEDFEEKEERKGEEEPQEIEDFILIADLLAKADTKTQFFVNKELNQCLQAYWLEVLTPPPEL